jgi:putative flippase GtrA
MEASFQRIPQRLARPVRFGLVGVSGVVINSTIVWALAQGLHMAIPAASALATEAAIVSNFLLNDRWTFAAAQGQGALARFLRFNGVALGGMLITIGILTLLTHYARAELLPANLAAISAATIWNYLANSRWTWATPTTDHRPPTIEQADFTSGIDTASVISRRSSVVSQEVAP